MEEKKKLGKFDIYSMGVGGTIGSGIFVMMGVGIAFTGRSISLAVGIGCIYMLLAYLFHPIMASMFTLPGGDYDMRGMVCGPLLTGTSAILTALSGVGASAYGLAIVDYVGVIVPGVLAYRQILASLIIILAFAATFKGSKLMAIINNCMTVILLASIALFIVFGLPKVQPGYFTNDGFFLEGFGGFIGAISIMSFACQGSTITPVNMMADTNQPRRTIPMMIPWIALTVGVVYAFMGVVASGALPVEQVAGQSLAVVAQSIFPRWLFVVFVLGGAVFAIGSSLMAFVAMMRNPLQQIAHDGWLPAIFKKKTKSGYPYMTQLLFFLVSVLPIVFDFTLDAVVSLAMIPSMALNLYMNLYLIRLVKNIPNSGKTASSMCQRRFSM